MYICKKVKKIFVVFFFILHKKDDECETEKIYPIVSLSIVFIPHNDESCVFGELHLNIITYARIITETSTIESNHLHRLLIEESSLYLFFIS